MTDFIWMCYFPFYIYLKLSRNIENIRIVRVLKVRYTINCCCSNNKA